MASLHTTPPVQAKTHRSELTMAGILDTALAMAAADGLESLTVGEVAKRLGLSKSGVFSRIGSRNTIGASCRTYSSRPCANRAGCRG